jgi:hypothetical protein
MNGEKKADLAEQGHGHDAARGLAEVRRILVRRGLLEAEEDLSPSMLEDLVHYAYFTGCITKRKVKELLGLTDEEARERIRRWKRWHEGNRLCHARQNPFYEGWADPQEESGASLGPDKQKLFEKLGRKG